MSPNWSAQPVNIFKNLASAEEQGRAKGGGVMALKTSCRTGPLPKYWGCASALDTAVGMCLSVCVCTRAFVCTCLHVCVCASVCVPRCLCMCVHGCDWMCSCVWQGSSRAPWGTRGSTSQFCGSLEVPSSQAAWEAAIAPVFSTSSGLYSFRKKKKKTTQGPPWPQGWTR